MTTHRRHTERGSALVMALVFVGVTSLVVMALLPLIRTNLRVTTLVRAHTDQIYAADAGVAHVLQSVRLDRTTCPTQGSTSDQFTDPDPSDGITLQLSCRTTAGSSSGVEGWAIIATGTGPGGGISSSTSVGSVAGPVFANDLANPAIEVEGDVFELNEGGDCTGSKPPNLTIDLSPPFGYQCVTGPVPQPVHALPAKPPVAPPVVTINGCRVYSPGTYTAATTPDVGSGYVYFRSGTYYFENVLLNVGTRVIGGERGALETKVNAGSGPCDTQTASQLGDGSGTGVQWILGGTSRIDIGNHGNLELYSDSGSGISVHAVMPEDVGGYVPSNLGANPLVNVGTGLDTDLAIHGVLYARDLNVNLRSVHSHAQSLGGMVVGHVHLEGLTVGALVTVGNAPTVRDVVITAVADSPGATGDVTAVAVVTLGNDEPRTYAVRSWRTGRATP